MALTSAQLIDALKRAEQDQSTEQGRLARAILSDPSWPLTASVATRQARIVSQIGTALVKHTNGRDRGYSSSVLSTIFGELTS